MDPKTENTKSVVHTIKRSQLADSTNDWESDLGFHSDLDQLVEQSAGADDLLNGIVEKLRSFSGCETVAVLQVIDGSTAKFLVGQDIVQSLPPESAPKLAGWAKDALQEGTELRHHLSGAHQWTVIVLPLDNVGLQAVLCAAVKDRNSRVRVGHQLRLAASKIELWHNQLRLQAADAEADTMAALLELTGKLESHRSMDDVCVDLANQLRSHLDAERVVIGLTGMDQLNCKMAAVSGLSGFDHRAELTRLIESAMNEALLRETITVLESDSEQTVEGTLAHKSLAEAINAGTLISVPLFDQNDENVGVCVVVTDRDKVGNELGFLRASQTVLGSRLAVAQENNVSFTTRTSRKVLSCASSNKFRVFVACVAVLALGLGMPMKYRIGCACQLEPVSRRFVAAPYDGTLEEALVKPGDVVTSGQLLARMDARELRWEIAGLQADYKSERKARDAAYARDEVAMGQQSDLEMKRLKVQIELIEHRLENLEIRSPVDGIVIDGDLEKSEGAPLTIGQTVFEIGPLSDMIVEVAIPERDILHSEIGMEVDVTLDSAMGQKLRGKLVRISPRSEMRDSESVYVAEVEIPNIDGRLRPGMKGTARINGERHSVCWILFHKAWESFAMMMGC